jgi:hypothetical protein
MKGRKFVGDEETKELTEKYFTKFFTLLRLLNRCCVSQKIKNSQSLKVPM